MAKRQIGREKQLGMSSALRMGLYSKPAATRAASLMQVPPSGPGNWCEPALSFQFRMWSKPSIVALLHVALSWNVHAAGPRMSTPTKQPDHLESAPCRDAMAPDRS